MTSNATDETAASSLALMTVSLFCAFCFENLDGDWARLGDCLDAEMSLANPLFLPLPSLGWDGFAWYLFDPFANIVCAASLWFP